MKRGVIGMKGKGEVMTYWLVGEDVDHRNRRAEERAKRKMLQQFDRNRISKKHSKSNKPEDGTTPPPPTSITPSPSSGGGGVPRSSLKNRAGAGGSCVRNTVTRCVSLESPKKLRFANGSSLLDGNPYHKCSHDPLTVSDVIFDEIAVQSRRPSKVTESVDEVCADISLSVSCPCIEHLPSSPTSLSSCNNNCTADHHTMMVTNKLNQNFHSSKAVLRNSLLTTSNPCIVVVNNNEDESYQLEEIDRKSAEVDSPLLPKYE